MSVTIMGRVFWTDIPSLSYSDKNGKEVKIGKSTAKFVLLAISDNADDFGENSWQSFETISRKVSIDRRSVMRAVRALTVNEYLTTRGVTRYGTNDYSINTDLLDHPPKRRERTGRPKSGDSGSESGDSDAESGGVPSPESSLNHPKDLMDGILKFSGQHETARKIEIAFEAAFGFSSLPWGTRPWEKFSRWLLGLCEDDTKALTDYAAWRDGPGKYHAMSNNKIRQNPQMFIDTGWPTFLAHSTMYETRKEKDTRKPMPRFENGKRINA